MYLAARAGARGGEREGRGGRAERAAAAATGHGSRCLIIFLVHILLLISHAINVRIKY